jgi:UDPglucose 6-dehydrogenase
MRILIVGTGYVGLVTGAAFAQMGHQVLCLDIDKSKIEALQKGEIPFYEPGLEELVRRNRESGRLKFTSSYQEGVDFSELCFICVPTPSHDDGSCDLRYVFAALDQIVSEMQEYKILIIKSTVPVGTCQKLKERISKPCDLLFNPEFLKQGAAVQDCLKPDRIIIGIDNPKLIEKMKQLYAPFTMSRDRLIFMNIPSAEMTKYAANAMLASRISFMNELSGLCEKTGANINDIRVGIGSDRRIGYDFLYPGVGYGGSCFPKDIRALQALAQSVDQPMLMLDAIDRVNRRQRELLAKKIIAHFEPKQALSQTTIAIFGLSFKPDTDDMREAPSVDLISHLLSLGATVRLYDPVSMNNARKIFKEHPQIHWCKDEYEAAEGADGIALVTEWKQFRMLDFNLILKKMQGNAIFDGRNQYKHDEMKEKGFDYFGIGIPK